MSNRGYDYNHATSGQQFLAILLVLAVIIGGGLALGLALLH
uniref:Uncharacterized protein n=1 Tax=Leviviridae sp. TaxID=2027243 RepID=A0A514D6F4_9VIRU|nr:MAG: hypothetical protein H2RhizoLitter491365_000003 [Leviviridae sp.]